MISSWLLFFVLCVLVASSLSNGLSILLVFVDSPVKDVVVLERFPNKKIAEDLAEIRIIGLVVKSKRAGVIQIDRKFIRESTAENFSRCRHLLFHNPIILLLLGSSFQPLPRKRATTEVEHHVAQRFHVITSRLFNTEMSVDACVPSRSCQVLVLAVRDVEVSFRVSILLGQTEIDHIDLIASLTNAHEEVVWLDVSVDEGLCVDVFDT